MNNNNPSRIGSNRPVTPDKLKPQPQYGMNRPITPDKIKVDNKYGMNRPITPDKIKAEIKYGVNRPSSGINPNRNRQVTPDRIVKPSAGVGGGIYRPSSGSGVNSNQIKQRQVTPDNLRAAARMNPNPSNRAIPGMQPQGRMKTPDKSKPVIIKKK